LFASDYGESVPTVRVGSHVVCYEDSGTGHPVLLISGMGISRSIWWKQTETLSGRYRLINMDNRDSGGSAPGLGPYTIADMAEDSAGLIRSIGCGQMHVTGWSMGGFIAMEMGLRYPELISKLVLVATSAGGSAHVPPSWEDSLLLFPREMENLEAQIRRIYSSVTAPGYMNSHPDDLNKVTQLIRSGAMSLESFQRQVGAVMTWWGVGDQLGRLLLPTLVLHGECDPLIPCANGRYLSANIRGAKLLTYENVGHLPPIEVSERFNRDIVDFLG